MLRSIIAALLLCLVASAASAANCYVTEYGAQQSTVLYPAAAQPAIASQAVAVSGSSAHSTAFNPATVLVRVTCAAGVSFRFSTGTPVAVATDPLLPSGLVEYFSVPKGQAFEVAFITNT